MSPVLTAIFLPYWTQPNPSKSPTFSSSLGSESKQRNIPCISLSHKEALRLWHMAPSQKEWQKMDHNRPSTPTYTAGSNTSTIVTRDSYASATSREVPPAVAFLTWMFFSSPPYPRHLWKLQKKNAPCVGQPLLGCLRCSNEALSSTQELLLASKNCRRYCRHSHAAT